MKNNEERTSNPFLHKYRDKLTRLQKQAARSITGDYKSRTAGIVTNMFTQLELPPLQERRKINRLVMLYRGAGASYTSNRPLETSKG
ncbi:hypothetical protein DPMN_159000 [Dreissena polymorpha]|uniref:Uncharacterized protein n=1 Tax=Dreissena polymorpha TaxID=45954 RepID=A0A9D4IQB3_DREPO|nr:hypothetical protein DPMN_159000 [Dreissena polymorpha]